MKKLLAALCLFLCLGSVHADELTGAVTIRLQSDLVPSAGFGGARERIDRTLLHQWSSGSGTTQINQVFTAAGTIAGGASVTLDLNGGTNGLGQIASFGHLKAFSFQNIATTTLTVGSGSAPIVFLGSSTYTASVPGSGSVTIVAPNSGYAVTAGTADSIHIEAPVGGTASYRFWAVGTNP